MSTQRFFGIGKPRVRMQGWEGAVETPPPPERVRVPLGPPGTPAGVAAVAVGEQVARGALLTSDAALEAVHAPVAGAIVAIGPLYTPGGEETIGIEIATAAEEAWVSAAALEDPSAADPAELRQRMTSLGLATGWSTLHLPVGRADTPSIAEAGPEPETLVVIATDREPELAVQRRMAQEFAPDLEAGLRLLRRMYPETRLVLAAPQAAGFAGPRVEGVEMVSLGDDYIANDWRLILARRLGLANTTLTEARRRGLVCWTAEGVAALGTSVAEGLPATMKLVTIQGPGLARPMTARVRLGSPLTHLLAQAGIEVQDGDRVLLGGAWRGAAQFDLDAPVTRETDGVTVLPAAEAFCPDENPCINCGRCVQVCPVGIQVNLVGRYAEFALIDEAYQGGAAACLECGLCGYVCPAHRPLLQYMRFVLGRHAAALAVTEPAEPASDAPEGAPAAEPEAVVSAGEEGA